MTSTQNRERLIEWLDGYERAWRTRGTGRLGELFTKDATYRMGPYEKTHDGLEAIGELWERERQEPEEAFTMTSDVVAVEGDTAVVRIEVSYGDPRPQEYRDLWVIQFSGDGRCRSFEEWPFWPEKGYAPGQPDSR